MSTTTIDPQQEFFGGRPKTKVPKRSRTYRFSAALILAMEALATENRRSVTTEIEIAMEDRLRSLGKLPPELETPSTVKKKVKQ